MNRRSFIKGLVATAVLPMLMHKKPEPEFEMVRGFTPPKKYSTPDGVRCEDISSRGMGNWEPIPVAEANEYGLTMSWEDFDRLKKVYGIA